MNELAQMFPTPEALLALDSDALGAKILALLCKKPPNQNQGMFLLDSFLAELWPYPTMPGYQPPFPPSKRSELDLAISEAWAWLEREGLLVPAPDTNGRNGWRVLSRRARGYAEMVDISLRAAPVTFPKELLHQRILEKSWPAYMRTDFDGAAFEATKAVEIAVRDAAGYGPEKIGVNLIQEAFSQGKGPLADIAALSAEQVSTMNLFWGAIGCYKNPQSHRDVKLDDPMEAFEIILLANHLLRIVDIRSKAPEPTSGGRKVEP
ncbi:MAG: TIGR02391 family protein [Acidobacteriaceae bacterium]